MYRLEDGRRLLARMVTTSRIVHEDVERVIIRYDGSATLVDVIYKVDIVDPLTGKPTGEVREVLSRYRFYGKLESVTCQGSSLVCRAIGERLYEASCKASGPSRCTVRIEVTSKLEEDCMARIYIRLR